MIKSPELELHARAQELFERENPGYLWRVPIDTKDKFTASQRTAGLIERQMYLARVRVQMRAEGVTLAPEENSQRREPSG